VRRRAGAIVAHRIAGRLVRGAANDHSQARENGATVVRDVALQDYVAVRSTLFTIRESGDRLVFTGRGFDHGVGLCQAAAFARLKAGDSAADVLMFYFPGTQVKRPAGRQLPAVTFRPSASTDRSLQVTAGARRCSTTASQIRQRPPL